MTETDYSISTTINKSYDEAEKIVRQAIADEGFGVLTEIDVQTTLKKKLDVEYPKYKIFGVCNPQKALEALTLEPEIGFLLPCKIILFENENQVKVSTVRPTSVLGIVNVPKLTPIAEEVEAKLKSIIKTCGNV